MLTKTVLCSTSEGACQLAEVPFNWQHGEALPRDAIVKHFPNAAEAMAELSLRGKLAQRVHLPAPPPTARPVPARALGVLEGRDSS